MHASAAENPSYDVLIDKPAGLTAYELHRIVAAFTSGAPALWADEGSQLRIRRRDSPVPIYPIGTRLLFKTTACASFAAGAHNRYLPLNDWRGRRAWFEKRSGRLGFSVLSLHVTPGMQEIQTHDGRRFAIDATVFAGMLQVDNPTTFARCLAHGVGRVGSAFGLNLLLV